MKKFCICRNNGVAAIITEETAKVYSGLLELLQRFDAANMPRPSLPPIFPTFTFSDGFHPLHVHTGNSADLNRLTDGCEIVEVSMHVPFSNEIELGIFDSNEERQQAAKQEMMYVTSLQDAMSAFDLDVVRIPAAV